MDQLEAKDTYEEAGRLFAEQRHADALILLERLAEAFPTQTEVMVALAKCLIELGRYEDAATTAQFIQDSLHDPHGTELLQSLPQETSAPPELPDAPVEKKPRRSRGVALALAAVGLIGAGSYYFFVGGDDDTGSGEAPAAIVRANAPSATLTSTKLPRPEPADAAERFFEPPSFEQAEPRSGLENMFDFPEFDFTPDDEAMIAATMSGDIDQVVAILAENSALANASAPIDRRRKTPLSIAAKQGNLTILKLLLSNEAETDPEITDYGWHTPLGEAVKEGHEEVVMTLVSAGADVNGITYSESSNRPIHIAAWNGRTEMIDLLLNKGVDIDSRDGSTGDTALMIGCMSGQSAIVEFALAKGADVNAVSSYGNTPLHHACHGFYSPQELRTTENHLVIAKMLVEHGADLNARNADGHSPQQRAESNQLPEVAQLLIGLSNEPIAVAKANVSPGDTVALQTADVAAERNPVDQNEEVATPLDVAKFSNPEPVAALLEPPDTESPHMSPGETLIELVKAEKLEDAVELLRNNRELANTLDYENRPVLTHAKSVEMAKLLVEAGADHELTTVGWTPLMWIAGRRGDVNVAKYLIDLGAWVSIEDDNGMRPIHHAAFMGSHELVEAFVEKGADINAVSDDHVTPLHGAAFHGDVDGVKRYLLLGADPAAQNKNGKTPYDTAKGRGNDDLLPLLNLAAPVAAVATPAKEQVGMAGTRDLNFSNEVRLGTIQIREWGSTDYKAWESAGSAWGTVTVPVGQEVMLMVNVARLDSLEAIGAADIQALYIRDLDLDDVQLKHLYHLKGLQRITLSRTGVSKAAIEALRAALPECTIRN